VRLRVPLHGYALLSAFLTTFVFASRLASISALPYTFIVVEIWACRISFDRPVVRFHPRPPLILGNLLHYRGFRVFGLWLKLCGACWYFDPGIRVAFACSRVFLRSKRKLSRSGGYLIPFHSVLPRLATNVNTTSPGRSISATPFRTGTVPTF
jgi:hypothetical protein